MIIPICLTWKMLASCPGSKLMWTVLKQKKKKEKLVVMRSRSRKSPKFGHFTLLFAEYGKEMYQNVKRTCRAIVFSHQAHCLVAFSLPSPSRFLLSSLLFSNNRLLISKQWAIVRKQCEGDFLTWRASWMWPLVYKIMLSVYSTSDQHLGQ